MNFAILGIGTALPGNELDQSQALDLARALWPYTPEQERLLPLLYRRAGVARRRSLLALPDGAPLGPPGPDGPPRVGERMALFEARAPELAAAAARDALQRARLAPDEVTQIVTVSCTGGSAPGLDAELIGRLGLAPGTQRTHVGMMGCHGALAGLRVARGLAAAEPEGVVMLCAVELCSLHFHYGWDEQRIVAHALFADGAAALVGTGAARAPEGAWTVAATGSRLFPDTGDLMTWRIRDHGFELSLSPRLPDLVARHIGPAVEGFLAGQRMDLASVASWAIHPGGPRVLSAVEESLALPPGSTADSRAVLADHGNMSSPTVLFILQRLQARAAPRPCVALAFGPGLVVEAALLT